MAEILNRAGVGLCSLESRADKTSLFGRMVLTVSAGIDEFERLIAERTSNGLLAAQEIDVRFERPPKLSTEQGCALASTTRRRNVCAR